jgi:hypothetical protein
MAKWAKMEVLEATTEWAPSEYQDTSSQWKDSTLVCMKVAESTELRIMLQTLNSWLREGRLQDFRIIEENAKLD